MGRLPDFALERWFAAHEFSARHLMCASDSETLAMADLLAMADDECRALWEGLRLGYTESPGHPVLRAEVAALYDTVEPDDVTILTGAEEGIFALAAGLLGPGDHAIVPWPAYQSLHEVAASTGASVTLVNLDPDDGWTLRPEVVRALVRPTTRLVVVNSPHNPTGTQLSREAFAEIAAIAEEAGATLLSDEVYRFGEQDPADRLPNAADVSASAASLGVMSKSMGLAGLRIGWIATRDRHVRDRVRSMKDYLSICPPAPSEILSVIGLRNRVALTDRTRGIAMRNLALLDAAMARWDGVIDWVRPTAGPIAFPRLLRGPGVERVAEDVLRDEGVLILPASVYGFAGEHFRIGFGRETFPEALAAFDGWVGRVLA